MAGQASRENGKKGGRPKGFAALEAERQREMIAKKLVKEFEPMTEEFIGHLMGTMAHALTLNQRGNVEMVLESHNFRPN